jgi:uncharacterized protein (DUF305 family)
MTISKFVLVASSLALLAACGRDEYNDRDSRASGKAPGVAANARPNDSALGAYGAKARPADSGRSVASATTPADSTGDQAFLRTMVNHQEGLIQLASTAMTKATKSSTKGDAREVHTAQVSEQKQLMTQLKKLSGDSVTPTVMPENQAANQSLQTHSGPTFDQEFYRGVVAYYREAITMLDEAMPRLSKPEVKRLAQKMKSESQKDIAEFEKKAQGVN